MTLETVTTQSDDLRLLVDLYFQNQKWRIAMGNRYAAIVADRDQGDPDAIAWWIEQYQRLENHAETEISRLVRAHPLWTAWLKDIKGIGPLLAGKLLGLIGPDEAMRKRVTVSQLWSFAGLGVVEGKAPRRVRGQKLTYNSRLRTVLYVVGGSFLKSGGKFSTLYYAAKEFYVVNRPDWTAGHIHMAALRKMNKIFLACLWQVWRTELGEPLRPLYVETLGHTTIHRPEEFVEVKPGDQ